MMSSYPNVAVSQAVKAGTAAPGLSKMPLTDEVSLRFPVDVTSARQLAATNGVGAPIDACEAATVAA